MSTRCRIGIENKDGTITSIYCHHDGYPEVVGEILVNHYKTEEKIRKLLELGDMSSLGTEPVENLRGWEMPKVGTADWMKAYKELHPENQCIIYRTRGEDCPAKTHKDIEEYQRHSRDCWGEYAYLFKNNEWFVLEYDDAELKSVERVLEKDEEDSE